MPLPLQHPKDRVGVALQSAMTELGLIDTEHFLRTLRTLRYELDAAYHESGAPYGYGSGWGVFRWLEETVNELQGDGVLVGTAGGESGSDYAA